MLPRVTSRDDVSIGCEDRLRNGVYCVEWGVKLYSNQPISEAAHSWSYDNSPCQSCCSPHLNEPWLSPSAFWFFSY